MRLIFQYFLAFSPLSPQVLEKYVTRDTCTLHLSPFVFCGRVRALGSSGGSSGADRRWSYFTPGASRVVKA